MAVALPTFDDSYLDRTPNKTTRAATQQDFSPLFGVLHETAGYGSLQWNLRPDVRSSYNYLIREGRTYRYVNERKHISWGAGVNSTWTLGGQRYVGGAINAYAVNIELEGPNDGTPMDPRNIEEAVRLLAYLNHEHHIPLVTNYWPEHVDVAPGYKTDARGYSGKLLVEQAARAVGAPAPLPASPKAVIGVKPSATWEQWFRSVTRHGGLNLCSEGEWERIYRHGEDDEIDPVFVLALAKHETGSPLGMSPLARRTKQLLNIRATAGEWRPTVAHNGGLWHADESYYQGLRRALHHLKLVYGWQKGLHTVESIIPVFAPATDGNNVPLYIQSVRTDMAYIPAH